VLAAEVHQATLTSSDLSWDAELTYQTGAPAVTRGPYLAVGTPEGMTIRWRTNLPTDSRVWLGSAPGTLVPAASDSALRTEHEIRVSGLSPATPYFYAVGTTSGVLSGDDPQTYFETAPHPDSAAATRVWVLGDSGLPGAAQDRVRDAYSGYAAGAKTDVWLMLGDNAYTAGPTPTSSRASSSPTPRSCGRTRCGRRAATTTSSTPDPATTTTTCSRCPTPRRPAACRP
jgi:hypothetical protein